MVAAQHYHVICADNTHVTMLLILAERHAQYKCTPYLLESLNGAALNKVVVRLLDAPVDLAIQLAWLGHAEVVLLAVKLVKQRIQASSDVPAPLHICKASPL